MAGVSDMQQSPEGSKHGGGSEIPSYGAPPAHQLDFYQAMADFKVMFPDMDEEIIEAVLRANNGGVDATIDQLLTMSVDTSDDTHVSTVSDTFNYKMFNDDTIPPELLDSTSSSEDAVPPPSYKNYMHCSGSSPAVPSPACPLSSSKPPGGIKASPNLLDLSLQEFLLPVAPPPPLQNPDLFMDITPFPSGIHDEDVASLGPPPKAPVPVKKSPLPRDTPHMQNLPAKKLYSKWKPPMLGRLPDDFLRLTLTPGDHICSSEPSSYHVSPPVPCRSKSPRKHRSTPGSSQLMEVPKSSERVMSSSMLQRRLAENDLERSCARDSSERLQYLEDERLALMLQNAEFLEELRMDEDFMKMLERDRMNATAFEPAVQLDPRRPAANQLEGYGDHDSELAIGAFPFDREVPAGQKDEHTEFRQQLNHMGRASRKKFVDVARKFFQRKKKLKPAYPSPVLDWQAQREGYNQLDNNEDDLFIPASCIPVQRSHNIDTNMRAYHNAADTV